MRQPEKQAYLKMEGKPCFVLLNASNGTSDVHFEIRIMLQYDYLKSIVSGPCLRVLLFHRSLDDPYFGISTSTFPQQVLSVLLAPINESDVEIKPDG